MAMDGRVARAIAVATVVLVILTTGAGSTSAQPAGASGTRPLVLPIPPGETWYVCQGYNGEFSHSDLPALDLSRARRSPGSKGCLAGSRYSSAGAVASAPAAGIAYRWPGWRGDDFVCIDLDSGGSIAIGHLTDRVRSGTRVPTGGRIGAVAWPRYWNGDYAHIHVQAHASPGCTEGTEPVAFDVAHGFKWSCTPDLPYSGTVNQYSGFAVSRCAGPVDGEELQESPVDIGLGRPSWLAMMIFRSIRLLGVSIAGPA